MANFKDTFMPKIWFCELSTSEKKNHLETTQIAFPTDGVMVFIWSVFSVHTKYKNSHEELWVGGLIRVQTKFDPKLGWALRCTGPVWKGA